MSDHQRNQPHQPAGAGPLSARFTEALVMAAVLHGSQIRKVSGTPYVAHLLAVAALVLEDDGSEDEAIAALLHDVVEDQGGAQALVRVRERFGDEVARIVAGCTETDVSPKPPWQQRKDTYLAHLHDADASVLRVALADKVHNVRTFLADHRREGAAVWSHFREGPQRQLWFMDALCELFARRSPGPLATELAMLVEQLREAIATDSRPA